MKRYTLVFIFNEHLNQVLLIRKTKPEEQAGKLNGIGGKMEDFDTDFVDCIKREVYEETKLSFPREVFLNAGCLTDNTYYHVEIFKVKSTDTFLKMAQTTTEEEVITLSIDSFWKEEFTEHTLEMIDICLQQFKNNL